MHVRGAGDRARSLKVNGEEICSFMSDVSIELYESGYSYLVGCI